MAPSLRLDFGNLPLLEAALRASFRAEVPLTLETIFKMRAELNGRFSSVETPSGHEVSPGISETIRYGPGVLNGVVYTGNEDGLRATIQSRVSVVRWTREFRDGAPKYPRYSALSKTLHEFLAAFRKAADLDTLSLAAVNVSYVNFLEVGEHAGVLQQYFSHLVQIPVTDDAQRIHNVELLWQKDDIDFKLRLRAITAKLGEDKKEGYELTTVAGISVEEGTDPKERLDFAHNKLQFLFSDLLSVNAKREWQLEENRS